MTKKHVHRVYITQIYRISWMTTEDDLFFYLLHKGYLLILLAIGNKLLSIANCQPIVNCGNRLRDGYLLLLG